MVDIYSRYDHPHHDGLINNNPSMTQQHFQSECDINNILRKYMHTGVLPGDPNGVYTDVSSMIDYRDALEQLRNADEQFSALPSHLRKAFDNNPAEFLDFISNSSNREQAIELGLIPRPTPEPSKPIEINEISKPTEQLPT